MFAIRLYSFLQLVFLTIDLATPENDVYFIINAPTSTAKPRAEGEFSNHTRLEEVFPSSIVQNFTLGGMRMGVLATRSVARPILPQGYVHYPDIKIAYKIYTDRLNWTSAQEACSSEGARLAVIDTPKKLEHVKNMRTWRNLVWTGIHRESGNGKWTTVHGGPISPDLPQIHYIPDVFGNCIAVGGLITLTRLRVMSCDATRWYVCEIPDAE